MNIYAKIIVKKQKRNLNAALEYLYIKDMIYLNTDKKFMERDEAATYKLRELYDKFGYKKFKMSKFEAYDLYLENKSFLASENIITFTDMNGRLLALKPDVTLSIIKNTREGLKEPLKVYYNENVYRSSKGEHEYKEIMQVGLECIGNVDMYQMCEVITLAKKSLETISENYIMDISHMGIISGLFDGEAISAELKEKLIDCIRRKNAHEIISECEKAGASREFADTAAKIAMLYGPFEQTLEEAKKLIRNEEMQQAADELEQIWEFLKATDECANINLDFSIINDMNYYNGIIFSGFVDGIPCSVLSGGRYDNLLRKFGKNMSAIGFAVYMNLIERYGKNDDECDVDILLTYSENSNPAELMRAVKMLGSGGKSIRVQKENCGGIRYKQQLHFNERGLEIIETND